MFCFVLNKSPFQPFFCTFYSSAKRDSSQEAAWTVDEDIIVGQQKGIITHSLQSRQLLDTRTQQQGYVLPPTGSQFPPASPLPFHPSLKKGSVVLWLLPGKPLVMLQPLQLHSDLETCFILAADAFNTSNLSEKCNSQSLCNDDLFPIIMMLMEKKEPCLQQVKNCASPSPTSS